MPGKLKQVFQNAAQNFVGIKPQIDKLKANVAQLEGQVQAQAVQLIDLATELEQSKGYIASFAGQSQALATWQEGALQDWAAKEQYLTTELSRLAFENQSKSALLKDIFSNLDRPQDVTAALKSTNPFLPSDPPPAFDESLEMEAEPVVIFQTPGRPAPVAPSAPIAPAQVNNYYLAGGVVPSPYFGYAPPPASAPVKPAAAPTIASIGSSASQKAALLAQKQRAYKEQQALEAAQKESARTAQINQGLQTAGAKVAQNQARIAELTQSALSCKAELYSQIAVWVLESADTRISIQSTLKGAALKGALAALPEFSSWEDALTYYANNPDKDQNSEVVWRETYATIYNEAIGELAKLNISQSKVLDQLKGYVPDALNGFEWAEKKSL